jgi:hypothetical protein
MTKESWHLSKQVPIALIIGLLVQTFTVFMWSGKMEARMEHAERQIGVLNQNDITMRDNAARLTEALARVEERIGAQIEAMRRLEAAITRSRQ